MITKTDLDYIEAKTRELVEKVLKTRVNHIFIEIFTKDNLDTECEVGKIRDSVNCKDHDRFKSESRDVTIFMPVKEG